MVPMPPSPVLPILARAVLGWVIYDLPLWIVPVWMWWQNQRLARYIRLQREWLRKYGK